MAPDEPTSAPVMIRAVFSRVNPMPAAAHPEYELSMETTTGMSAPPMGMMISTPMANASRVRSPERDVRLRAAEPHRERHEQYPEDGVEEVLSREHDRVGRRRAPGAW